MANHEQAAPAFEKFFTDSTNNPFFKVFKELNAPLCGSLKQSAAQYLHTTEEWGKKALELNEKLTAWAKETPLSPLFETQRSVVSQLMGNSIALARKAWQLDENEQAKAV
ncbi:MAG: hypothetical protein EXR78_02285 [Deltaproteobacteria bacterium]|nr:hypothetical protein [Deltaproteobacteria bacterium]